MQFLYGINLVEDLVHSTILTLYWAKTKVKKQTKKPTKPPKQQTNQPTKPLSIPSSKCTCLPPTKAPYACKATNKCLVEVLTSISLAKARTVFCVWMSTVWLDFPEDEQEIPLDKDALCLKCFFCVQCHCTVPAALQFCMSALASNRDKDVILVLTEVWQSKRMHLVLVCFYKVSASISSPNYITIFWSGATVIVGGVPVCKQADEPWLRNISEAAFKVMGN